MIRWKFLEQTDAGNEAQAEKWLRYLSCVFTYAIDGDLIDLVKNPAKLKDIDPVLKRPLVSNEYLTPVSSVWCLFLAARPIAFVDMGNLTFNTRVKDMVARHYHVIAAPRFDVRNRPLVDAEELQDALCAGPEQVDPSEFRAPLMAALA